LREHRGVVERGRRDEGAQLDPLRRGGEARQQRPRLPRAARLVATGTDAPVQQVIADPHRVEPGVLGELRHRPNGRPARLVLDLRQLDSDAEPRSSAVRSHRAYRTRDPPGARRLRFRCNAAMVVRHAARDARLRVVAAGSPTARAQPVDRDAEQLSVILAHADLAYLTATLGGVITRWSAGAERLFGWRGGQIVGQRVERLSPPDLKDEPRELAARVLHEERVYDHRTR